MPDENNLPKGPCNCAGHEEHLCVLSKEYFHVYKADKFKDMVKNPAFKCQFCGRVSKEDKHLCFPTEF